MTAKIKLNAASGGGSISIQAPSSSSNNRVIALPDLADGTLLTSQSSLDSTKLSPAITSGKLLQVVQSTITSAAVQNINAGSNYDWSSFSASITPASTSNKVLITAMLSLVGESSHPFYLKIKNGTTGSYLSGSRGNSSGNKEQVTTGIPTQSNDYTMGNVYVEFLDSPSTTSAVQYYFTISHGSNNQRAIYINQTDADTNSYQYSRGISTLTLKEIAA